MENQSEQQHSWWQQIKSHPVISILIAEFIVLTMLVLIGGYAFHWAWTGFTGTTEPYKTLHDWLQLLIVPVALAVGGLWFTKTQRKAEQVAEARQKEMEKDKEKRAEENYQLRRFYENIYQAYNAAKRIRRLLKATARRATAQNQTSGQDEPMPTTEPPGQDEIMILIKPYGKQMQELVDVQLQFETFKDEIKSNPKLFSEKVFQTMESDLETIEKYLNHIVDEYEALYKNPGLSDTTITLSISQLDKLKDFIDKESKNNDFFKSAHRVRDVLRERLISEISSLQGTIMPDGSIHP